MPVFEASYWLHKFFIGGHYLYRYGVAESRAVHLRKKTGTWVIQEVTKQETRGTWVGVSKEI